MSLTDLDTTELARKATEHVAAIVEALDALDLTIDALVDRDSLATLLYDLRDVKQRVAEVYGACESHVIEEAGERSFDLPNLGRFEVRKSVKRSKWDHDSLVSVLVRKANEERKFNSTTGEVEPEGEAVARTLRDCISFGQGKVTGLRARGIEADEFCQVDGETYSVSLPAVLR